MKEQKTFLLFINTMPQNSDKHRNSQNINIFMSLFAPLNR